MFYRHLRATTIQTFENVRWGIATAVAVPAILIVSAVAALVDDSMETL